MPRLCGVSSILLWSQTPAGAAGGSQAGGRHARYSIYLLYWYKSTNTDTEAGSQAGRRHARYSVYVLYWYKSTNTDTEGASLGVAAAACEAEEQRGNVRVWEEEGERSQRLRAAQELSALLEVLPVLIEPSYSVNRALSLNRALTEP